tara:strand:- start:979 stop:1764 length:786 start_codon:yes stop_codon:yes gene_type:complete
MNIEITEKSKFNKFANVFRNLPVFMDTVNIHVKEDGLYIQGMDTAQVCLFELNLHKEWFNTFSTDKPYVLGIHCATFYKVIHCIDDSEQIMKLIYNDGDKLEISLEGGNKNINKYFELPLIDIDTECLVIPPLVYDADLEICSHSITNYINELMIFDETFTIKCTDENISLTSKSECGSLSIVMKEDSILMYAIEENSVTEQSYSLKYVKNMCLFSKITNSIVINLKKDTPMRFHQSFDDVEGFEDSKNYIRFYIAPKMDD